MKKSILLLVAAVTLLAYPVFGQISITGQNLNGNAGSSVSDQLTLSITGTNTVADVESINMLLRTFAGGGGLNGSSFFTISGITPLAPFSATNTAGANFPIAFDTAGDAANSGSTVNTATKDTGSNAPAGSNPVNSSTGATIPFENVTFAIDPGTPAGVYNFAATLGGFNDAQGSYIANMSNGHFDVSSTPTFTITVAAVPEPATWSLMGLGGLGAFALNLLRARRRA